MQITRKSSYGKPQETYHPWHILSRRNLFWGAGVTHPCPGGDPISGEGSTPSLAKGTPIMGYPRPDLGPVTGVPPTGKDMGPVEALWDGDGVPTPRRDGWQTENITSRAVIMRLNEIAFRPSRRDSFYTQDTMVSSERERHFNITLPANLNGTPLHQIAGTLKLVKKTSETALKLTQPKINLIIRNFVDLLRLNRLVISKQNFFGYIDLVAKKCHQMNKVHRYWKTMNLVVLNISSTISIYWVTPEQMCNDRCCTPRHDVWPEVTASAEGQYYRN